MFPALIFLYHFLPFITHPIDLVVPQVAVTKGIIGIFDFFSAKKNAIIIECSSKKTSFCVWFYRVHKGLADGKCSWRGFSSAQLVFEEGVGGGGGDKRAEVLGEIDDLAGGLFYLAFGDVL